MKMQESLTIYHTLKFLPKEVIKLPNKLCRHRWRGRYINAISKHELYPDKHRIEHKFTVLSDMTP
jgi:hypothetical protein